MRHFRLILNISGEFIPAFTGFACNDWLIFPEFGRAIEIDKLLRGLRPGEHIQWL